MIIPVPTPLLTLPGGGGNIPSDAMLTEDGIEMLTEDGIVMLTE